MKKITIALSDNEHLALIDHVDSGFYGGTIEEAASRILGRSLLIAILAGRQLKGQLSKMGVRCSDEPNAAMLPAREDLPQTVNWTVTYTDAEKKKAGKLKGGGSMVWKKAIASTKPAPKPSGGKR